MPPHPPRTTTPPDTFPTTTTLSPLRFGQDHPFNDGPPEPLSSPAFATEYRFDATNKEGGVWKILRWEMQAHFTRQAIEVNGRVQGASSSVTDMELAKL